MNTEFENLTTEQHHTQLTANVAWLRMVLKHLQQSDSALHEDVPDKDKINNACGPLQNAIVYIEDEICKTLKIES